MRSKVSLTSSIFSAIATYSNYTLFISSYTGYLGKEETLLESGKQARWSSGGKIESDR